MILIIGGAFQGKNEFAKKKFGVCFERIFDDFHIKIKEYIINGKNGNELINKIFNGEFDIIISDEIGCGIVPVDKYERLWREETGRMLCDIAERCDEVWRVCCGIGIKIK